MTAMQAELDPVFSRIFPILGMVTDRRPFVVEIGVHHGTTTRWFHAAARQPLRWVGFEPDPRNIIVLEESGYKVQPYAISDMHGRTRLYMSGGITPGFESRVHTDSSSIRKPTDHLKAHPWCTFEQWCEVGVRRLDDVMRHEEGIIDLIWADVQGAQRQVIGGAAETLKRTRYLYIEVHPSPMYDGETTFEELCALLPDWEVVQRYPADVLFQNVKV